MEKDKLLEILKEILGTCEDAYSCCPEGDICTDTSDTMYYIDHARDELEKLIIKIENNA
tara:strand:- start:507 stop:683 length:177 start_codon:yes stop_codon:yes gene_type:complete